MPRPDNIPRNRRAGRFFIPGAPDNMVRGDDSQAHAAIRGQYLRYINGTDGETMNERLTSRGPGRPPFKIVQGKDTSETLEIAESLGLPASVVDVARNRIVVSGHILASLPIEEYVLREREKLDFQRMQRAAMEDAHKARIDATGRFKPVVMQVGEFHERKEFNEREGQPFVAISAWNVGGDTKSTAKKTTTTR